jgi:hypothetical protein
VLRTSGDGRRMIRVALAATERCSVRHHRLRVRAALLSDGASRPIGRTGQFAAVGRVGGARVGATGTFFSTHAFGSLTVSEHNHRWGTRRSGPVLWTAT